MIKTTSINVFTLCVPCYNRCRYCLLSWDGSTIGADYERSKTYAEKFYEWLKQNRPEIKFSFYFGYSMEHEDLIGAVRFMQQTGSPGGRFLQLDGLKMRTKEQLQAFILQLKAAGIEQLNFTFYGTKAYHDKFAARAGDFDLMQDALDIAKKTGLDVSVGVPVTQENLAQLDELVELFERKNVGLYLFTPHSKGRGITLLDQKIRACDYERCSDLVKKHFNRQNNKTPFEWLNTPLKTEENRVLSLSLTKKNIQHFENQSFECTIQELEKADERFYARVPSFQDLLKKYADKTDERLYSKKDLYFCAVSIFYCRFLFNISLLIDKSYQNVAIN